MQTVSFVWSWLSFFAGAASVVGLGFWLIIGLAYRQYKKRKKSTTNIEQLFSGWNSPKE